MIEQRGASFVAECFWPGVAADDLPTPSTAEGEEKRRFPDLTRGGLHVRYLGSILMAEDEVVLCQFEGTAAAVRPRPRNVPRFRSSGSSKPSGRRPGPYSRDSKWSFLMRHSSCL